MTKPKRILSQEQIEAYREDARRRNPNREKIDGIRDEIKKLSGHISELTSDDEKYCNLLMFLSKDFDSRIAATKVMSNQEIGSHLASLFYPMVSNEIDEAILSEALDRLGYDPESDEQSL
jgi:hypothetical protein